MKHIIRFLWVKTFFFRQDGQIEEKQLWSSTKKTTLRLATDQILCTLTNYLLSVSKISPRKNPLWPCYCSQWWGHFISVAVNSQQFGVKPVLTLPCYNGRLALIGGFVLFPGWHDFESCSTCLCFPPAPKRVQAVYFVRRKCWYNMIVFAQVSVE